MKPQAHHFTHKKHTYRIQTWDKQEQFQIPLHAENANALKITQNFLQGLLYLFFYVTPYI